MARKDPGWQLANLRAIRQGASLADASAAAYELTITVPLHGFGGRCGNATDCLGID